MKSLLFHLFIPQDSNNHRAKILHHRIIFVLILFFFLSPMATGYMSSKNVLGASISISAPELTTFTNNERQRVGLSPLRQNELLAKAAEAKAADMFSKNYWAHVAPDGTTPWFFIQQAGYEYVYAGENLAKGFNSSEDVVGAWMNSPTHRDNILSQNYEDVGFAVSHGTLNGEQTSLVVQEFGGKTLVPPATKVTPEEQKPIDIKTVEQSTRQTGSILGIPRIQGTSFSQKIVILTILTFLAVLTIDMIFAYKRKIIRLAGHNLDHLLLFAFMVILLGTLFRGSIL